MKENRTEFPAVSPDAPSGPSLVRRSMRALLFLAIWGAFVWGAVGLQNARLNQVKLNPPYIDKMFTPQTEYAKVLAFGYDMAVADFLYVRAIQAFGAQFNLAKKDHSTVFHFFDTMVALDPQFLQAYEFGELVMADGGHPELAIELGEKGWYSNPMEYRMPFLNAYTANWTMHDPKLGKLWAMKAVRTRNCPDWVERWLAYFDRERGLYEAALEYQMRSYLTCMSEQNREVEKQIALMQVDKIAEEWHLVILNQAVEKYLEEHDQSLPADLAAVVAAGYLKDFRAIDYPATVHLLTSDRLDTMLEEKRKTQPAAKYLDLLDAAMGIGVHEQSGVPASPPENNRPNSYVLRHDVKPELFATAIKNKTLVATMTEAHNRTLSALNSALRPAVRAFLQQKEAYPKSIEEAFPVGMCPGEPVTGRWDYDSETGTVRSPTFPDL